MGQFWMEITALSGSDFDGIQHSRGTASYIAPLLALRHATDTRVKTVALGRVPGASARWLSSRTTLKPRRQGGLEVNVQWRKRERPVSIPV